MRLYLEKLVERARKFKENWPDHRQQIIERLKKAWENRPSWQQSLRYAMQGSLILVGLVLMLILSVYFGGFGRLPSKADLLNIRNANASEIYAADGPLLGKYYAQNRTNASLEEIPHYLINALVATEDARFYVHKGIDPRALVRVFFRTILLGDLDSGGGSTISQQLIKNLFPRKNHGFLSIPVNKIREMILALRIEKVYSKAQIMEMYLNTVPFGERDVYGVKVAAKRFFNQSLDELRIEEAAVLVGMLKANSYYNPVKNPEGSTKRRNTVLGRMVQYGFLQQEDCDSLRTLPLETTYVKEGNNQGLATYFRAHLKSELEEILAKVESQTGKHYDLEKDGLKIYTSIDSRLQRHAEESVAENMPVIQKNFFEDWKNRKWLDEAVLERAIKNTNQYAALQKQGLDEEAIRTYFDSTQHRMDLFTWEEDDRIEWTLTDSIKHYLSLLNTGVIVVDPQTGLVKAWVGGIDHGYFQYDHVKSSRQIGSTFKPVVFASALESAIYPCDFIENKRETYPEYEDWSPRNADGKYGGYYSMPGALSKSVNTVTVRLMLDTGEDTVRNMAANLGMRGEIPEGPAISLGTMNASLWDMVQVYSTFANEGKRPELHYLSRIEDRNGKLIYERPQPNPESFEQVISPESNAILVNMLETVVDSGTARKLRYRYGLYNEVAGKTGTTQNQSDGWFMGFTPKLAVGVWVGAELPSVHFRTLYRGQGGNTALPIAGDFLKKVNKDRRFRSWRNAKFPALVDSLSYMLDCPLYLEEIPLADELIDDYLDNPGFFERLYREIGSGNSQVPIQLKRRRNNESEEEYLERMRRYNERRIKRDQKKRDDLKAFWGDKLFGKMKEEQKKKNNNRNENE